MPSDDIPSLHFRIKHLLLAGGGSSIYKGPSQPGAHSLALLPGPGTNQVPAQSVPPSAPPNPGLLSQGGVHPPGFILHQWGQPTSPGGI